jgi:hypothetical protein
MDNRRLYDDDFYAWSEEQASVLRRMAETPGRLPNELDIEHVAEEIEDLGKSQRDAAESFVRLILVHLIKLAVSPCSSSAKHWRSEIVSFHIELLSKLTPAMRSRIDLDRLWVQAKRQARAGLEDGEKSDGAFWTLAQCPFDLALFVEDEFDLDLALNRLRSDR